MDDTCTWCGCAGCDPTNAFHSLLRRHDLHSRGWSEIRDGWLVLVDDLVEDLFEMGWSGNIAQIKEKFGVLCFYAEDTDAAMAARILRAERMSRRTCEVCGAPAQLAPVPGRVWLRTRCAEHARQPPDDPDRQALPGWFAGQAHGVRPLAPAVQLLLTELRLETGPLTRLKTPPALWSVIPETPGIVLIETPDALTDVVACNILAAWLAMRQDAVPYFASGSRRTCAERLLAIAADIPLAKLVRHDVNKVHRAAIRANTSDLLRMPAVVDDAGGDMDDLINRVRGVAVLNDIGLIVVAGLGRQVRIQAAAPAMNADDEAVAAALARLVFLAEDLECVLVAVTADRDMARLAATDSSLSMGITVLNVHDHAGVLAVGDLRLRLLPSGRLAMAEPPTK